MLQILVIFAFFAVIPVILLIREILFLHRTHFCTTPVEGIVTALYEEDSLTRILTNRNRSLFYVQIQYPWGERTLSGTARHKFTYDTYGVDLPVTVYIDPDDPENFVLPRERTDSRNMIVFWVVILFILLITSAVVSEKANERNKQQKEWKAFQDKLLEASRNGDTDTVKDMWKREVTLSDGTKIEIE